MGVIGESRHHGLSRATGTHTASSPSLLKSGHGLRLCPGCKEFCYFNQLPTMLTRGNFPSMAGDTAKDGGGRSLSAS